MKQILRCIKAEHMRNCLLELAKPLESFLSKSPRIKALEIKRPDRKITYADVPYCIVRFMLPPRPLPMP